MSFLSGSEAVYKVGSVFVKQYYNAIIHRPDLLHLFYRDFSCVIRVDGCSGRHASATLQIQEVFKSLNYGGIEVETINGQESLGGRAIVMMVTGFVKIKNVERRRKFVQSFFLAPQPDGFYILNDIFRFIEFDDPRQYLPQEPASTPIPNPYPAFPHPPPVPQQQQQRQQQEQQAIQEDQVAAPHEQPLEEAPPERTYASVLRDAIRKSATSAARRLSIRSAPAQPPVPVQQPSSASTEPVVDERKIAFVRNLPLAVNKAELEREMSRFGKINGIKIIAHAAHERSFAHVEYEEIPSVGKAIEASPIPFDGRVVSICKYDPSRDSHRNKCAR